MNPESFFVQLSGFITQEHFLSDTNKIKFMFRN